MMLVDSAMRDDVSDVVMAAAAAMAGYAASSAVGKRQDVALTIH